MHWPRTGETKEKIATTTYLWGLFAVNNTHMADYTFVRVILHSFGRHYVSVTVYQQKLLLSVGFKNRLQLIPFCSHCERSSCGKSTSVIGNLKSVNHQIFLCPLFLYFSRSQCVMTILTLSVYLPPSKCVSVCVSVCAFNVDGINTLIRITTICK